MGSTNGGQRYARAASGHVAAPLMSVMNSRRFILAHPLRKDTRPPLDYSTSEGPGRFPLTRTPYWRQKHAMVKHLRGFLLIDSANLVGSCMGATASLNAASLASYAVGFILSRFEA